jgi:hypothetical protein
MNTNLQTFVVKRWEDRGSECGMRRRTTDSRWYWKLDVSLQQPSFKVSIVSWFGLYASSGDRSRKRRSWQISLCCDRSLVRVGHLHAISTPRTQMLRSALYITPEQQASEFHSLGGPNAKPTITRACFRSSIGLGGVPAGRNEGAAWTALVETERQFQS